VPGETATTVRATTWATDSAPTADASPPPGDDQGHRRERQLEGERAGVAEPVAVPEAQERGPAQGEQSGVAHGVPGVVGGEVLPVHVRGLRHGAHGAHTAHHHPT
jgi:hypothetical protein